MHLRNCVGVLNQTGHLSQTNQQISLSSLPTFANQPNRPFDSLTISRLIDELSGPNELAIRLEKSTHVLLSKGKSKLTPEEQVEKKRLNKLMEAMDIKSPDRPPNLHLKSSLNPQYDPHEDRPSQEQLEEFYKYVEKAVSIR